jgi:hypothetical protein
MSALSKAKQRQADKPGARVKKAIKIAKVISYSFIAISVLAIAVQLLGYGTPGMAWYVYQ